MGRIWSDRANPYWVNYRNLRENSKNRYMVGAQLSYKVLPCLTLSGRVRFDDFLHQRPTNVMQVLSATFLTTQNAVTMVKRTTRRSKSLPTSLHRSTKTSVKIGIYKPTSVAQSTICVTNQLTSVAVSPMVQKTIPDKTHC